MAKGDDKNRYTNAQNNAATQTQNVQQGYSDFTSDIAGRMPADRARADEERAYLTQGYRGLAEGGGRDYLRSITGGPPFLEGNHPGGPGSGSGSGSGSGGGGGGIAGPSDPYGSVRGGFGEFANTGGVDYGRMTEALGTFRDLANTGGFSQQNRDNLARVTRGYSDIADRPFDRTNIDSSISNLREFGNTGGYRSGALDTIGRDIGGLRNFQSIDPERMAALRSGQDRLSNIGRDSDVRTDIERLRDLDNNGFGEFARTGGYSGQDIANIRSRSNSAVPSFYSNVRDEMARRNAVSGGFSPGYSAGLRAVTRDQARGAADQVRDTELGISDRVREGRQFGLTGQANARNLAGALGLGLLDQERQGLESGTRLGQELDLALASNRLRGLEGAVEAQSRLEADVANNRLRGTESAGNLALNAEDRQAANRLSALGGLRDTELDTVRTSNDARLRAGTGITDTAQGAERTVQSGRQFGLSGLMGIAQAEEASRQAAAARAAASAQASQAYDLQRAQLASQNERFAMEMGLNALGGLSDLYRSAPGEVGMYNDDYLGGLSGWNDSIGTGVLAQSPMPKQGGFNWQSMATAGIGQLGNLFRGGGSGGSGAPVGSYTGASDEYGRPIEPMYNDNYFGSPTYPGTVTTEETYRDPSYPDFYPDQPWFGGIRSNEADAIRRQNLASWY